MSEKYALITGASRGIGKAIALKIAFELPYTVLLNYKSNEKLAEELKTEIEKNGGKAELLGFDVADRMQTAKELENWKKNHPEAIIEVVINNAGINKDNLFMWMEENEWDTVIDTSVNGFYNVTKPLIQDLLRNKYGRIINIVSVSGLKGTPGQTNYSAAKGAIIAATKALAQEIAKRNVTVNAVAPGFIETDMTADLNAAELKKQVPMQRFGKAEEVADLVCFLASKKSSYITGEIININGGIYS